MCDLLLWQQKEWLILICKNQMKANLSSTLKTKTDRSIDNMCVSFYIAHLELGRYVHIKAVLKEAKLGGQFLSGIQNVLD